MRTDDERVEPASDKSTEWYIEGVQSVLDMITAPLVFAVYRRWHLQISHADGGRSRPDQRTGELMHLPAPDRHVSYDSP